MPLTPDEARKQNEGKVHLQLDRAIQDLLAEVEAAVALYTGDPIYVGLTDYLQYKAQADHASEPHPVTLEAIDEALFSRFGPAGWTTSIVTNPTSSYYWVKLRDAREKH